jgi:hypothetical protein
MFDDIQIEEVINELEEMDIFDINEIDDIVSTYDEYWFSGHEMEEDIMF